MARINVVIEKGRPVVAIHAEEVALDEAAKLRRADPDNAKHVSVWDVPVGRSVGAPVRIERGA